MKDQALGIALLGVALFLTWRQYGANAASAGVNQASQGANPSPNANNESERLRDQEQARNGGWAKPDPLIQEQNQTRLDYLLNPAGWKPLFN
jgi:hypothetical protein